MTKRKTSLHNF